MIFQIAIKFDHSNSLWYRVLACGAGGSGFDSGLRRTISRCSKFGQVFCRIVWDNFVAVFVVFLPFRIFFICFHFVSRKHGFYLNFKREVLWLRGDDSGAGCIYQLAGNTRYIMFFHARNRFRIRGFRRISVRWERLHIVYLQI